MNETPEPQASEPTRIQQIKSNIRAGENWLKTGNYSQANYRWDMWKANKAALRCDWTKKPMGAEESTFHTNIPYGNYRTIKPTLVFNDPYINVESKKPEFERDSMGGVAVGEDGTPRLKSDNFAAARLMEVRMNHEIKQCKVKDVLRRCVGHAKGHYGIGWGKVGHQELTVSGFNNDRDNKTNYWVDWVDPRDKVFDWRAVEARKIRWEAERIILPKKDALDMGFKVPPSHVGKLPEHILERDKQAGEGVSRAMRDTAYDFIEFWEYHDHDQKTIDWVLLDSPAESYFFMKETSVQPFPFEGSSYIPLVIDDDDDDLIGITDIQPISDYVDALDRMRTREVYHMDNFGTGLIEEESASAGLKDEKKKYKKTPYGYDRKVKDGYINKIKIQTTPSMGQDHYNFSAVLTDEARTRIGITDYQQGGSNVQRKATEAQIIRTDAALRVEDSRHAVGDFVIEIARRFSSMFQEFDTETEFYNVANEEFDDDFVEVLKNQYGYNPKIPFLGLNRDRIQGEFDYSLNIEDMIHQPKEARAAQLARSIQAVAPNPILMQKLEEKGFDIGDAVIDMFELSGVNVKKYQKGGPAQIPAMAENEMFKNGMEVPEPHRKDNDDEHILAHGPLRRQLEQAVMELQGRLEKLQGGLQMIPEMMPGPEGASVTQNAKGQVEEISQQLDQVMAMLRNVKLHTQAHVAQGARKASQAMGGTMGGPMGGMTGEPPSPVNTGM